MTTETTHSNIFYKNCYRIAGPVIKLFRPIKVIGRENMISGPALICGNHSAMIDPILVALAFDVNTNVHVFAKIELFRVPVIAMFVRKLQAISVDRKKTDASSIKTALTYLKKGEKVLIFPEGTRLSDFDADAAKNGAVKLAERAGVPVIPVYIPRKKPFFIRSAIIFGEPYFIEKTENKRTNEDYTRLAKELMEKIEALGSRR